MVCTRHTPDTPPHAASAVRNFLFPLPAAPHILLSRQAAPSSEYRSLRAMWLCAIPPRQAKTQKMSNAVVVSLTTTVPTIKSALQPT